MVWLFFSSVFAGVSRWVFWVSFWDRFFDGFLGFFDGVRPGGAVWGVFFLLR